jgi:hypothetical protein
MTPRKISIIAHPDLLAILAICHGSFSKILTAAKGITS